MCWVYRAGKTDADNDEFVWVVGYFVPGGEFEGVADFPNETDAMLRVHFLNGGPAIKAPVP